MKNSCTSVPSIAGRAWTHSLGKKICATTQTRLCVALPPSIFLSADHGDEHHHVHGVFEPPFNPWGAPFWTLMLILPGGLAVSGFAYFSECLRVIVEWE